MTEEQIFKARFSEYCVGEKCLSPYFDLFQIGFEEGESRLKAIYKKQRNKRIDELQKQCKKLEYAKTIIQDLLNNSDEYARQRAMDWLKEE